MINTYELAIKYDQAEITNNKILLEQCNDEMKYLTADEKEQVEEYRQW